MPDMIITKGVTGSKKCPHFVCCEIPWQTVRQANAQVQPVKGAQRLDLVALWPPEHDLQRGHAALRRVFLAARLLPCRFGYDGTYYAGVGAPQVIRNDRQGRYADGNFPLDLARCTTASVTVSILRIISISIKQGCKRSG